MTYASPRRFCAFAEGLISGAAAHFAERVHVTQTECLHRGDTRCVFRMSFARREA
jgi:predicted hydrocarbon binding protein